MIITIDGPTASGKSTLARHLAKELKYYYINSGLLFRALAYLLITKKNYSLAQIESPKMDDISLFFKNNKLKYVFENGKEAVFFNGDDITPYLKTPEIDQAASLLSTNKKVRVIVMEWQRKIAQEHDVIVDGRDTGSVVFPNADYKFYLTATLEKRAQRWQKDQAGCGKQFSIAQAREEIALRDERDMHREHDPLIIPAGAYLIDNTDLDEQQTVETILNSVHI